MSISEFFFKNPVGKFLFDVAIGAAVGAGTATLGLGPTASFDQANSAIAYATILGARSAAATALLAAVRALRGSPA